MPSSLSHGITAARTLHANALKSSTLSNIPHATRILNCYCKGGIILDACQLFDEFTVLDLVCWNSIISGCVQNGEDEVAFRYFKQMHHYDYCRPDSFTLSSLLSSPYCLENDARIGEQFQGYALKSGVLESVSVGNALVTLHARWGKLREARLVFESMSIRNVVSWTAVISGHARQCGHEKESLKLFLSMLREEDQDQRPNEFTLATIFSSCGKLASSQGIPFIAVALKMGFLSNIHVQNSLIGYYSECGLIREAKAIFNSISNRDIVSWNSLLKGYSQQGMAEEALRLFEEMKIVKIPEPDTITFLSALSACKHTGMVSIGLEIFKTMKLNYGIEPQSEHISCIVDLLGRAGQLREVEEFIKGVEFEHKLNDSVWRTLLGACRAHGKAGELAAFAASKLVQLDPHDSEAYIVLSQVYATGGQWNLFKQLRREMKDKGVEKEPGMSWIEFENTVHSFVAGDWSHPKINHIQTALITLVDHIKESDWKIQTT